MKITENVQLSPDIVLRHVGDETMLLNLATGTYYGLDAVGSKFIWLIEQGCSALEARDAVLADFDVEAEVLNRDLEGLLESLRTNGIIQAPG